MYTSQPSNGDEHDSNSNSPPSISPSPSTKLDPVLSQAAVSLPQVAQNDALTQVTDQIALETIAVALPTEFVDRLQEELQKVSIDQNEEDDGGHQHRHGWSLEPQDTADNNEGREKAENLHVSAAGTSVNIASGSATTAPNKHRLARSRSGCSIDLGNFQGELYQILREDESDGTVSGKRDHKQLEVPGNYRDGATVIDLNASVRDFVEAITADHDTIDSQYVLPESTAEEILTAAGKQVKDLDQPEMAVGTAVVAAPDGGMAVVAEIISGDLAEAADIADAEKVMDRGASASTASASAILPTVEEGKVQDNDQPPASVVQQTQEHSQPLSYIIARHPVWIATGFPTATEIDESIAHLDNLIAALKNVQRELYEEGLSPSFETKASSKSWFSKQVGGVYETLPSVNVHTHQGPAIPVPSPAAAVKYYQGIRDTWIERKRYVEAMDGEGTFCSCIADWAHSHGDVLSHLSNQSLEQDMIREASDSVTARMAMAQPGSMRGEAFDRLYAPETCPTPESVGHLYIPKTSIRIVGGRDDYLRSLTELALHAENSIDIATCYVFPQDPAQRYILLDLLPYVARTRGVTVRLLVDMMPIESSLIKSALRSKFPAQKPEATDDKPKISRSGISPTSFLDVLPFDAPPFSSISKQTPESPMVFIQMVLQTAFSIPNNRFEIKWWCARDSQEKYRIKNHAKCVVFDGKASKGKARGRALMGGSNICPTLASGDSDLDLLVGKSDVVNKIGETFDFLWDNMCDADSIGCTDLIDTSEPFKCTSEGGDDAEEEEEAGAFPKQAWLDQTAKVALIRSEPCSAGSDAIFRHVLGAIASAKTSIYMCMGHSNKPMALARALGDAVKRGVRVQLLVNSIYSCDLRVNQRDLFRSIQNLLMVAPGVEVWTTALRSHRKAKTKAIVEEEKKDYQMIISSHNTAEEEDKDGNAPPFLHSKYTVVDSKWTAVGSWNVWTRSAFYEIEHELLIESEVIARRLIGKFEKEKDATSVLLTTPEECAFWCPTGCKLCMPFGPFYA